MITGTEEKSNEAGRALELLSGEVADGLRNFEIVIARIITKLINLSSANIFVAQPPVYTFSGAIDELSASFIHFVTDEEGFKQVQAKKQEKQREIHRERLAADIQNGNDLVTELTPNFRELGNIISCLKLNGCSVLNLHASLNTILLQQESIPLKQREILQAALFAVFFASNQEARSFIFTLMQGWERDVQVNASSPLKVIVALISGLVGAFYLTNGPSEMLKIVSDDVFSINNPQTLANTCVAMTILLNTTLNAEAYLEFAAESHTKDKKNRLIFDSVQAVLASISAFTINLGSNNSSGNIVWSVIVAIFNIGPNYLGAKQINYKRPLEMMAEVSEWLNLKKTNITKLTFSIMLQQISRQKEAALSFNNEKLQEKITAARAYFQTGDFEKSIITLLQLSKTSVNNDLEIHSRESSAFSCLKYGLGATGLLSAIGYIYETGESVAGLTPSLWQTIAVYVLDAASSMVIIGFCSAATYIAANASNKTNMLDLIMPITSKAISLFIGMLASFTGLTGMYINYQAGQAIWPSSLAFIWILAVSGLIIDPIVNGWFTNVLAKNVLLQSYVKSHADEDIIKIISFIQVLDEKLNNLANRSEVFEEKVLKFLLKDFPGRAQEPGLSIILLNLFKAQLSPIHFTELCEKMEIPHQHAIQEMKVIKPQPISKENKRESASQIVIASLKSMCIQQTLFHRQSNNSSPDEKIPLNTNTFDSFNDDVIISGAGADNSLSYRRSNA